MALRAGELEVVKASVTGSIIGNLLLVFGAAAVAGGWRRKKQSFNRTAASAGNATLFLAAVALVLPALQHRGADPHPETRVPTSVAIAMVLLVLYALSLVFTLRTHAHLYAAEAEAERPQHWRVRTAVLVLVGATVAVASELLVASLEGASHALGWNRVFVGVIVVAIVGNAAEHSTAVLMAMRDKMDLALHIAVESSKQVALFVAPVLVLTGLLLGQPMDLVFSPLEVVAVAISTGAVTLVALDGETNWLEGAMLIAVLPRDRRRRGGAARSRRRRAPAYIRRRGCAGAGDEGAGSLAPCAAPELPLEEVTSPVRVALFRHASMCSRPKASSLQASPRRGSSSSAPARRRPCACGASRARTGSPRGPAPSGLRSESCGRGAPWAPRPPSRGRRRPSRARSRCRRSPARGWHARAEGRAGAPGAAAPSRPTPLDWTAHRQAWGSHAAAPSSTATVATH